MIDILVPRETVNDETVIVVSVMVESESHVLKGQILFEFETSKTVISMNSPEDGIIYHNLSTGDELKVGSAACQLKTNISNMVQNEELSEEISEISKVSRPLLSKKAMRRAQELKVSPASFNHRFVSASDIESLVKSEPYTDAVDNHNYLLNSGNRIVIVGGGGHAKMCIDILQLRREYEIVGILDSQKQIGSVVSGVEVIGTDDMLEQLYEEGVTCAVNGIGSVSNPGIRKLIFNKLKKLGYFLPNLIHPSAVVEPSITIGEGNQIMMGALVGSSCKIGDNCVVNSGAVVSHDSVLFDHVHIAPGAVLGGSVIVGETSLVGMGVTIYLGLKVGSGSIISNGVNIFQDVDNGSVVKA